MPDAHWTPAHDIALLYMAAAYGFDDSLSDAEAVSVQEALAPWAAGYSLDVRETLIEAATLLAEGDTPDREVAEAVARLSDEFSPDHHSDILKGLVSIAEADGVLLQHEQGLITHVAKTWGHKALGEQLMDNTTAAVQSGDEDWSLIHELAFLFVAVAHAGNHELNSDEVAMVKKRLGPWHPDLGASAIEDVIRTALQVYAASDQALIQDVVRTLKQALPDVQRLAVLDDLYCVARADGPITDEEESLIEALGRSWDVQVRLSPTCGDA
ncbi:MAG: TerB family tellurite resistance protein [Longimonas sp.]|uniref:TerB family tellurite resistance protein n=1 Tax=Longimonas sp. TaxID=2039626 RepID=UPI00334FE31B